MKVKSESEVAQLCPTLHDPMDCSLPGSSVHGISQARVLEWVAIAFSFRRSRIALIQNSFTELCLLWSCGFLCLNGCPVSFLYMPSKACCCKHPETPVGATGWTAGWTKDTFSSHQPSWVPSQTWTPSHGAQAPGQLHAAMQCPPPKLSITFHHMCLASKLSQKQNRADTAKSQRHFSFHNSPLP